MTVAIARKVFVGDEETASEPILSGRDLVSIGVGTIPVVGTIQSAVEFVTGCDDIAGERVHCGLAAVGLVAGMVPGGKGALKAAAKGIGKFVRGDRIVLTDDLIGAANQRINEEGLTKAGRALDKHAQGQRETGTFPPLRGWHRGPKCGCGGNCRGNSPKLRLGVDAWQTRISPGADARTNMPDWEWERCGNWWELVLGICNGRKEADEQKCRNDDARRRASPFVHQRWRVIPVEEK